MLWPRFLLLKVKQLKITRQITRTSIFLVAIIIIYIFVNYLYLYKTKPGTFLDTLDLNRPLWDQNINFEYLNLKNDTEAPFRYYIVPNYVHFVRFDKNKFTYSEMICVLAALKNQKPEKIIFHKNHNDSFIGPYWNVLNTLREFTDIVEFNYVEEPSEIFGQPIEPLMRLYHGSDITRIRILMKYGGIFLDNDSYVIKSLDEFRKYEMTLNWDENQYLGTQVLLAHKDARFLKLWLNSYKGNYRGDLWYYNAGERPTKEILWKRPDLIHRVKVLFGVDTNFIYQLFQREWSGWRDLYALHLCIHHQYLLRNISEKAIFPIEFNERNIGYYPITFRQMAYDVYHFGNISWPKEQY